MPLPKLARALILSSGISAALLLPIHADTNTTPSVVDVSNAEPPSETVETPRETVPDIAPHEYAPSTLPAFERTDVGEGQPMEPQKIFEQSSGACEEETIVVITPRLEQDKKQSAPQQATASTKTGKAVATGSDQPNREPLTRRQRLSRTALAYRGTPYVWGGESQKSGFDCSGFTRFLYLKEGISLPHRAKLQFKLGKPVPASELRQGDLVFFNTTGPLTHVGMYIGNNKFIHAANPRRGVKVDSLSSPYYKPKYAGARRYTP